MTRGYARAAQRNQEAREALVPLSDGERPLAVTIGAVISTLLALLSIAPYLAGVEVRGQDVGIGQVLPYAVLSGLMAYGMWRARYWAVLGFQVLLGFVILGTSFGLVGATTIEQVLGNVALLCGAGALFFFMVKAMARIQMPSPSSRD